METSFGELKKKEVINVLEGKRLGKVCDVVFTFPEGKVLGIVVPGGKGFHWGRGDLFVDLRQIKKVGVDVVLVELQCAPPPDKKPDKWENCPPRSCPPPQDYPPPRPPRPDRRDYGEYE